MGRLLARRVGVVAWIVDGIRFISLYSWVGGRFDRRLQLPPVLCGHLCRVGCHSPSAQPDAPPGRLCVARHQAAWRVNGLPGMAPSPPRRHKRVVPCSTIRSSLSRRSSFVLLRGCRSSSRSRASPPSPLLVPPLVRRGRPCLKAHSRSSPC